MWLIYAFGGGWGHLTRAVALARVAQRDRPVRILTNSPYAACITDPVDIVPCSDAAHAIAESRPECLIVDTFPRGLGGELAGVLGTVDAPTVLVHRDLNPRYVAAKSLREFVAAHYDLVLVPGRGEGSQFGDLPMAVETPPWLVRSADELRIAPREESCILVCAAGKPDELDWYGAVVRALLDARARVRCVAALRPSQCPEECWIRHWPAMELFGCASVVIGGAGYNTVAECLAWGVPLVARAWTRKYDRQERRAGRAAGRVALVRDPAEAARAAMQLTQRRPPRAPLYVNGVTEAVRLIYRLAA